jgi:hypothetical protein
VATPGSGGANDGDLARLDQTGITAEHWKILFISGMGFFTDAYDLFCCTRR